MSMSYLVPAMSAANSKSWRCRWVGWDGEGKCLRMWDRSSWLHDSDAK